MPAHKRNQMAHVDWTDETIALALRCIDAEQEARQDAQRPDVLRADSRQNRNTQRLRLGTRMSQVTFEGQATLWVLPGDQAGALRFRDALHTMAAPTDAYQRVFGCEPEAETDTPHEGDSWAGWFHRCWTQFISERVTLVLPAFTGVQQGDNGISFRAILDHVKNPEVPYEVGTVPEGAVPANAARKILA